MPIVAYTPEHYPILKAAAETVPYAGSLHHRSFVDWYYGTSDWCRLYLALLNDGSVGACIGIERLLCEHQGQPIELGIASNFATFKPGPSAPTLFLHWVRTYQYGCVFGGTADVHAIVQRQKWTYYPGVRPYQLNTRYTITKRDALVRRMAKSVLRAVTPDVDVRTLPDAVRAAGHAVGAIHVEEERSVTADMLPPPGAFTFRLASPLEHLNWRYAVDVPVVRYRIFRILRGGASVGYVVINDKSEWIMVAHADGPDPETMAIGMILAVARSGADGSPCRPVILTATHPQMRAIFTSVGFRPEGRDRDFAIGNRRGGAEFPLDTSNWVVHFDWTDNGVRAPFLDERPAPH